jgi:DUF4097 and DUF4098 domain-containing protein YvlB
MSRNIINGMVVDGDLVITNGKVFVNGKQVTTDGKVINISIEGNVDRLQVDACDKIFVNGDVGSVSTASGDITLNECKGNIHTTSGDVDCSGDCNNIQTVSGDVKVRYANGSIKTVSGDINNMGDRVIK